MLAILPNISLDQIIEIVAASSLGTLIVQWLTGHLNDTLYAARDAITEWAATRRGSIVARISTAAYIALEDGLIDEAETKLLLEKLRKIFPNSDVEV